MRGEDELFRVAIDPRRPILALSDTIEVDKDGLDVVFVLVKEGVFDGLA